MKIEKLTELIKELTDARDEIVGGYMAIASGSGDHTVTVVDNDGKVHGTLLVFSIPKEITEMFDEYGIVQWYTKCDDELSVEYLKKDTEQELAKGDALGGYEVLSITEGGDVDYFVKVTVQLKMK